MITKFPPQMDLSIRGTFFKPSKFHFAVLQSAPTKFRIKRHVHSHCFVNLKACLVTFSLPLVS